MFLWHIKQRISKSTQIALVQFVLGLGLSCVDTVWALYFNTFGLSDSAIGFISSALVVISFVTSFIASPILERYDLIKLILWGMIITAASYVCFAVYHNFYLFLFLAVITTFIAVFRVYALDITFRDNTASRDLNKQEGLFYALLNLGWFVGPLIAGYFLVKFGINSVFVFSGIIIFVASLLFLFLHLKTVYKKRTEFDTNIFKNVYDFFRIRGLMLSYLLSGGIYVWWSLVYIYVPLFAIEQGASESYIGIFFSLVVLPLLLCEYLVGKLSAKYGFKLFFVFGYLGLTLICVALFFINNIYIQLIIVILASFFVACLEPLQDTFFFRHVSKKEEEKYYPVYGTATDVGGFVAKFFVAVVLLFLSYKFAYLTMALIFLFLTIAALGVKKSTNKFTFS